MKQIYLVFLLVFFKTILFSQIGFKTIYFQPTENFGFVFKPSILPQLVYAKRFSELTRWNGSLTIAKLNTRLDTFPTYAIEINSNGAKFLPSKEAISDFWYLSAKYGIDFGFYRSSRLAFYAGSNLGLAMSNSNSVTLTSALATRTETGAKYYIGVGVRLGTEVHLTNKWDIIIEAERTYSLSEQKLYYNYYDLGLGLKYNFKY